MSKFKKSLDRLLSQPKDFTWREAQTILTKLGYVEYKNNGSRRKFVNKETKHILILHEPHPSSILKSYAVNYIIEELKRQNLI